MKIAKIERVFRKRHLTNHIGIIILLRNIEKPFEIAKIERDFRKRHLANFTKIEKKSHGMIALQKCTATPCPALLFLSLF